MSAHQTETAYLRHAILCADGDSCRKLEKGLVQVESDQRCVKRVAWLMAQFLLLAMAGVAYEAIFQENFPNGGSGIVLRLLCGLGLSALICLVGFAGLLTIYRLRLNRLRKECLQLVVRVLEGHPGQSSSSVTRQPSNICRRQRMPRLSGT